MGSRALLRWIFPTQGSSLGLPLCRDALLSETPGKAKEILIAVS